MSTELVMPESERHNHDAWMQVWDGIKLTVPNLREDNKPLAVAASYELLRRENVALNETNAEQFARLNLGAQAVGLLEGMLRNGAFVGLPQSAELAKKLVREWTASPKIVSCGRSEPLTPTQSHDLMTGLGL